MTQLSKIIKENKDIELLFDFIQKETKQDWKDIEWQKNKVIKLKNQSLTKILECIVEDGILEKFIIEKPNKEMEAHNKGIDKILSPIKSALKEIKK